jgi:hypothetical protein
MDKSKMDRSQNSNVWIPRNIQHSCTGNKNHPNTQAQGKTAQRSLMQSHPLKELGSKGVPVDCRPNWTWNVIKQAAAQGPHCSSMEPDGIKLVHEDIQYQVDAGFSQIVLWTDIQNCGPSTLNFPHSTTKKHRSRLILNLSFPVYPQRTQAKPHLQPLQQGVNDTTSRLVPYSPVRKIGNVFSRVLSLLHDAQADEVVMLSKIDLSDGLWWLLVEKKSKWNFAYQGT